MKKIYSLLFLLAFSLQVFSQDTAVAIKDTTWKRGAFGSVVFNQVAFNHWAAGGENSYSFTALGFGFANYHFQKNYWNSYANLQYGMLNSRSGGLRKNTDVIELQTKGGHEIGKKFYFTGLINFKSQFANGYIYPNDSNVVSKFAAPAYLIVSLGFEWKPVDYFSLYLSPATGKFTFITDQTIADYVLNGVSLWGNDPAVYDSVTGALITHGATSREEFGAYFTAQFIKDVVKNVNVATRLALFNNYTDPNKQNRKNIDVAYDLLVTMKVNNWLSANFFTNIIYDNDIFVLDLNDDGTPKGTGGPRTQIKEGLGIGITYKIGDEFK